MRTLHISVSDKKASYANRDGEIVCGNSDYVIEFAFDAEWAAHEEKTARFVWNGHYENVDFTGNTCPVPIITNTTEVKVGVYAGDLSTTTSAVIGCQKSILCESTTPGSSPTLNGDNLFVRYSAYPDGTDFTETRSLRQFYIGVATGQSAPTDKSEYTWFQIASNIRATEVVTLRADAWQDNAQTVEVPSVMSGSVVSVSPDTAEGNVDAYIEHGVMIQSLGSRLLMFTCVTQPAVDIVVIAEILDPVAIGEAILPDITLPTVSDADNGKVLGVEGGEWKAVEPTDVSGALYNGQIAVSGKTGDLGANLPLFVGAKYKVIFDGTEYECTFKRNEAYAYSYLGNGSMMISDIEDTGEPFCVGRASNTTLLVASEGEHTLIIFGNALPEVQFSDYGMVPKVIGGVWSLGIDERAKVIEVSDLDSLPNDEEDGTIAIIPLAGTEQVEVAICKNGQWHVCADAIAREQVVTLRSDMDEIADDLTAKMLTVTTRMMGIENEMDALKDQGVRVIEASSIDELPADAKDGTIAVIPKGKVPSGGGSAGGGLPEIEVPWNGEYNTPQALPEDVCAKMDEIDALCLPVVVHCVTFENEVTMVLNRITMLGSSAYTGILFVVNSVLIVGLFNDIETNTWSLQVISMD